MEKGLIVPLDELEAFIQLIQIDRPELKSVSYKELAEEINKEFKIEVNEHDLFLLYEPTIQEEEESNRIYYGSMFNNFSEIY